MTYQTVRVYTCDFCDNNVEPEQLTSLPFAANQSTEKHFCTPCFAAWIWDNCPEVDKLMEGIDKWKAHG